MSDRNEEHEIDLVQLWETIRRNMALFVCILLLAAAIPFSVTKFLMEKKYTATATVIIVKDTETSNTQAVTYTDVQLSQKLVSTYTQIMLSEAISDEVISNLHLDMNTSDYRRIVSVSAASNTEVMNISATTNDPKLSASIANEVVDVFQRKIPDIMKVDNVTVLNRAKVPSKPSGPNAKRNGVVGLLIGLIICGLITVIKMLTDTKVKTEEDVKKIFDYPVIGVIPEFTTDAGGRRKTYGSE